MKIKNSFKRFLLVLVFVLTLSFANNVFADTISYYYGNTKISGIFPSYYTPGEETDLPIGEEVAPTVGEHGRFIIDYLYDNPDLTGEPITKILATDSGDKSFYMVGHYDVYCVYVTKYTSDTSSSSSCVRIGNTYNLGTNNINKADEYDPLAVVYFENYYNEHTAHVKIHYEQNGWDVYDATYHRLIQHYNDGESFVVPDYDIEVKPSYIETRVSPEFEEVTGTYGWISTSYLAQPEFDPQYANNYVYNYLIDEYTGSKSIDVEPVYQVNQICHYMIEGEYEYFHEVPCGTIITLPVNDTQTTYNYGYHEFHNADNSPDYISDTYLKSESVANGWRVPSQGYHYDGDQIAILEDNMLIKRYTRNIYHTLYDAPEIDDPHFIEWRVNQSIYWYEYTQYNSLNTYQDIYPFYDYPESKISFYSVYTDSQGVQQINPQPVYWFYTLDVDSMRLSNNLEYFENETNEVSYYPALGFYLPNVREINMDYRFVEFYDNPDFTGDPITYIEPNENGGDIALYTKEIYDQTLNRLYPDKHVTITFHSHKANGWPSDGFNDYTREEYYLKSADGYAHVAISNNHYAYSYPAGLPSYLRLNYHIGDEIVDTEMVHFTFYDPAREGDQSYIIYQWRDEDGNIYNYSNYNTAHENTYLFDHDIDLYSVDFDYENYLPIAGIVEADFLNRSMGWEWTKTYPCEAPEGMICYWSDEPDGEPIIKSNTKFYNNSYYKRNYSEMRESNIFDFITLKWQRERQLSNIDLYAVYVVPTEHSVTMPYVVDVAYEEVAYEPPRHSIPKDSETVATLTAQEYTANYLDEELNADGTYTSNVVRNYNPFGWRIEGTDYVYSFDSEMYVDDDITLVPEYTASIQPAYMPTKKSLQNVKFDLALSDNSLNDYVLYNQYYGQEDVEVYVENVQQKINFDYGLEGDEEHYEYWESSWGDIDLAKLYSIGAKYYSPDLTAFEIYVNDELVDTVDSEIYQDEWLSTYEQYYYISTPLYDASHRENDYKVTVKAVYDEDIETYTIIDTTGLYFDPIEYNEISDDIVIPNPEKEGYVFTGWTFKYNCRYSIDDCNSSLANPVKNVTIAKGSGKTFSNIQLTPNFEERQVTVTNYSDGESQPTVEVYNYGYVYTIPNNEYETITNHWATVTFNFIDAHTETRDVISNIYANGWEAVIGTSSETVHFNDGDQVTLTDDLQITWDYNTTGLVSPEFPAAQEGYAWFDASGKRYTSYKKTTNITLYEQPDSEAYEIVFGIDSDWEHHYQVDFDNATFSKAEIHTGDEFTTPEYDDYKDGFCYLGCYDYKYNHVPLSNIISHNTWKPVVNLHYDDENSESNIYLFAFQSSKDGFTITEGDDTYDLELGQTYTYNYNFSLYETPLATTTGNTTHYDYDRVNMKTKDVYEGTVLLLDDTTNPPAEYIPEGYEFAGWYTEPVGGELVTYDNSLNRFMTYQDSVALRNQIQQAPNNILTGYEGFEPIDLYAHYTKKQITVTQFNNHDNPGVPNITVHEYGEEYNIGENDFPLDEPLEDRGTITFVFDDGSTEVRNVVFGRLNDGWFVSDDGGQWYTKYPDNTVFTLVTDLIIYRTVTLKENHSPEFPEAKPGYAWFDANGVRYTEYAGDDDITLYELEDTRRVTVTQYNNHEDPSVPTVTVYDYGTEYNIGVNDIPITEPSEDRGAITFEFDNGTSEVRYVKNGRHNDGWVVKELDSQIEYNISDNSVITLTSDLLIRRVIMTRGNYSPEFPETKPGYAWFDANGNKYRKYDGDDDITLYELVDNETYQLLFRVDTDYYGNIIDNPVYSSTSIHDGDTFTTPSLDDYEDGFCSYAVDCANNKKTYIPLVQLISENSEWQPTLVIHYMDDDDTVVTNPDDEETPNLGNFWVEMDKTGYTIAYDNFRQDLNYDTTYTFNYGRDISEVTYNNSGPFWGRNMAARAEAKGVIFHIPMNAHPYVAGYRKAGYVFAGWYTEPNGEGTRLSYGYDNYAMNAEDTTTLLNSVDGWYVDDYIDIDYPLTDYTGFDAIHVYAKWEKIQYNVTYMYDTPEVIVVDPGESIVVRENNIEKANENGATITFNGNGSANVAIDYTPNGWTVTDSDGNEVSGLNIAYSGATITVNQSLILTPNYTVTKTSPVFPTPTGSGDFLGWFTEPNGQGERLTEYTGDDDITLYPYFTSDAEHVVIVDGQYLGIYNTGDTVEIPHFDGNELHQSGLITLMNRGSFYQSIGIMSDYFFEELYLNGRYLYAFYYSVCDNYSDHCVYTISSSDARVLSFENNYDIYTNSTTLPIISDTETEHFDGWYTDPTDGNKVSNPYRATQDTTLYARWSEIDPTKSVVTYKDGTVEIYNKGETLREHDPVLRDDRAGEIDYEYNDGSNRSKSIYYKKYCNVGKYYKYADGTFNNRIQTYNSASEVALNENFIYLDVYPDDDDCFYDPSELLQPEPLEGKVFAGWYYDPDYKYKVASLEDAVSRGWTYVYGLWKNEGEVVITYEDGSIEIVPAGTQKDIVGNQTTNYSDYISLYSMYPKTDYNTSLTFGNNVEDYKLSPVITITTNKWTVNDVEYLPGETVTINEDSYIVRDRTVTKQLDGLHDIELRSGDDDEPYYFAGWISSPRRLGYSVNDIRVFRTNEELLNYACDNNKCNYTDVYAYWVDANSGLHFVTFDYKNTASTYYDGDEIYLDRNEKYENGATVRLFADGELYSTVVGSIEYDAYSYYLNGDENITYSNFIMLDASYPIIMNFTSIYDGPEVRTIWLGEGPSKEGYRFESWNTDPNGNGEDYYYSYYGTEDIDLYAKYVRNYYSIYFYDLNGRYITSMSGYHGDVITLPDNAQNSSYDRGSVTFDSGMSKETRYVTINQIANGWKSRDGIIYEAGTEYTLVGSDEFTQNADEETVPVTAPTNDNPNFIGWFSEMSGGSEYTPYSGDDDITYYAHYSGDTVALIYPDGTWNVPRGSEIILRNNTIVKANDAGAQITFVPGNNQASIVSYVEQKYTPNGWTINGQDYADEDIYVANEDTTILANYTSENISPSFPTPSNYDNNYFEGWYADLNDLSTKYTEYTGNEDITLYARYIELADDEHMYYIDGEFIGVVRDGEIIDLPYMPDTYGKWGEFTLMNGNSVYTTVDSYGTRYTGWYELNGHGNIWVYENSHNYEVASSDAKQLYFTTVYLTRFEQINLDNYIIPDTATKHFTGWYTTPTGGDRIYTVSGERGTYYAQWQNYDPTKVIVKYSNGRTETYNIGDTLNRYPDTTFSDFPIYYDYNDGTGRTERVSVSATCPPNRYYLCKSDRFDTTTAEMYQSNEDIILTENFYYIHVGEQLLKYCNWEPSELLVPEAADDKEFLGWYSEKNGGERFSAPSDMTYRTVYGQWRNTGDVIITYEDGTLEIVPAGTVKTVPSVEETVATYAYFEASYPTTDYWTYWEQREGNAYDELDYQVPINRVSTTISWDVEGTTYNPDDTFTVNDDIYVVRDRTISYTMDDYHDIAPHEGDENKYEFIGWTVGGFIPYYEEFRSYGYSGKYVSSKQDIIDYARRNSGTNVNYVESVLVSAVWVDKDSNEHIVTFDNGLSSIIAKDGDTFVLQSHVEAEGLGCANLHKEYENTTSGICYIRNHETLEYAYNNQTYQINDTFEVTADMPQIINITSTQSVTDNGDDELESFGPEIAHRHFVGWYSKENGQGTKYTYVRDISGIIDLYAYYALDKHNVTTPEGTEQYDYGTNYEIPTNNYPKDIEDGATITFNLNYENAPEGPIAKVKKQFTPAGWTIDGEHYNDGEIIRIVKDIELIPDYVVTNQAALFPDDPVLPYHAFEGWYTEAVGGTKVESYDGDSDITLYAHWTQKMVKVFKPDDTYDEVAAGSSYTLPTNNYDKANTNVAAVTFKYYQNRLPDETRYVTKSYTNNGWLIDNEHYDDGATITVGDDDIYLVGDYVETTTGVEFPTVPADDEFANYWATRQYCGSTAATSYSGTTSKTFYEYRRRVLHVDYDNGDPIEVRYYCSSDEEMMSNFGYPDKDYYDFLGYTLYIDGEEYGFYDKEEFDANGGPGSELYFQANDIYYTTGYAVLKADYELEDYYISYTLNGGSASNPSYYNYETETFTLNNPTKSGYVFVGWTGTGLTEPTMTVTIEQGSSGYRSYTANYKKLYTVTYPNGSTEQVADGTIINLGVNNIARAQEECNTFEFWDNTTYDVRETYLFELIDTQVYYTTFVPNGWYVKTSSTYEYEDNDEIVVHSDVRITPRYDEINDMPEDYPVLPEREHYTFLGWDNDRLNGEGIDWDWRSEAQYCGALFVNYASWEPDPVSVTTPDGTDTTTYKYGNLYEFDYYSYSDEPDSPNVIFKYEDGETPDFETIAYIIREANGYTMNGVIQTENEVRLLGDAVFEPIYDDFYSIDLDEYPEDPTREHYTFDGWYTADGKNLDDFDETDWLQDEDIILYAHWVGDDVTISWPGGSDTVEYGSEYTMPTNNITKASENIAEVTFDADNDTNDIIRYVQRQFTPNGWTEYSNGQKITATEDIELEPDYIETIVGVTFPENPTKEHYVFGGWYEDGDFSSSPATSYNGEDDTTFVARWTGEIIYVTDPNGDTEEYHYGDEYIVPSYTYYKDPTDGATVTFVYQDGVTPDSTETMMVTYTNTGFDVNGDNYHEFEPIILTEDIVVTPTFTPSNENIIFEDATREHYEFQGWYTDPTGGVRMYEYSGDDDITVYAHWIGEEVTVTYADGTTETKHYADVINLGTNNIPRDDENVAMVMYSTRADDVFVEPDYVIRRYTPNGWIINNQEYNDNESYTLYDSIIIEANYSDELIEVVFPDNLYREHYTFDGWYTAATGGSPISSYAGTSDKTVYAHWTGEDVTISWPGGSDTVEYGTQYTLPTNNIAKANDNIAEVVFKPKNGDDDIVRYVQRQFTPNGWTEYSNGQRITATEDIELEPEYTETIIGVTFPTNPTREHYSFQGWYDGNTEYTTYNGTSDLILTAKWLGEDIPVCINDNCENIEYGTEYNLGENNIAKANENLAAVTFKYNDDVTDDYISYVQKQFTPNGWLVNGVNYNDNDVINVTEELTIVPKYIETTVGAEFPADPTREHYSFEGWFNGETEYTSYNGTTDLTLTAKWLGDTIIVEDPEPHEYHYGDEYTFKSLPTKNDENVATVTFKPENGSADITRYVTKTYTAVDWTLNGTHYNPGDKIELTEDINPIPQYSETINEVEFPADPTREHYSFEGWFNGETEYTSYNGTSDLVLTAKWLGDTIIVEDPEPHEYHYGDEYTFKSLPTKNDENVATVTFKPENGSANITRYVTKSYTAVDWVLNGTHYNPGDKIELTEDINPIPQYSETINEVEFPADPTREHYSFEGWFNGETEYTSYNGTSDLILTAKWLGEDIPVCINDNCENIEYGTEYNLGENNIAKANENLAAVTFKYNDGETDDYVSYVQKQFTPNGWLVNGVNYNDNDVITVTEELTIVPKYIEATVGAEFPADPTREHYSFQGWFNGETEYTSYNGTTDLTLTAKWLGDTIIVTDPEPHEYHYGDEYTFKSLPTKNDENVATVTFKPENGSANITRYVTKTYTAVDWTLNGTHYNPGDKIELTEDINPIPQYSETINEVEFPADPTREHYSFEGWFDGETEYTSYNGTSDLILTAKWLGEDIPVCINDNCENIEYGTEYNLGENNIAKANENLAAVTFKYNDGETADYVSYVQKQFTPNGWLVNNVNYNDNEIITVTEELTIVPKYIETIVGAEFPEDPQRANYSFDGWFSGDTKLTSYSDIVDITLNAHWTALGPNSIDVSTTDIVVVKGETKQIEVTTTPANLNSYVTYTSNSDIITVSEDGLVTANNVGTTTITVGITNNPDITETVNVTVVDNAITSDTLTVDTRDLGRIIIGANENTTVEDFLAYINNDAEYLEVYNAAGDKVTDYESLITTGARVKLVIDDHEYDEVIVIIRGDIDQDGIIDVSDKLMIKRHILLFELIEDYRLYAADLDYNAEATIDDMIDVSDNLTIAQYILGKIKSLNPELPYIDENNNEEVGD